MSKDATEKIKSRTVASCAHRPPLCPCAAEAKKQSRVFVTMVLLRVMEKCHILKKCKQESWLGHAERLINQTVSELVLADEFNMKLKGTKLVAECVFKDLQKHFGKQTNFLILVSDPGVEAAIIGFLKAHIQKYIDRPAKKGACERFRNLLAITGACYTLGVMIAIIILMVFLI